AGDGGERATLAESLAGSRDGAEVLLKLVETGEASADLLVDASVAERLKLAAPTDVAARLEKLGVNAAKAGSLVGKLIADRRAAFDAKSNDGRPGQKVFEQFCTPCHRIGVQGGNIGPQLDGIGGRGVDRLLEDILDPSRNVDAHFRMTYVST